MARRCDGKRCSSGSRGIRRADGGGPANWRAAESRVSQRRAVAAAPLLIAPGAAAGGGWIQRPWRRRWRRQLPSDPRQRLLDCSPYAGDMGTRQPLPSLGAPSPVRGNSSAALPPLASVRCPLRKCPRFAPSPEPCQRLRGRLLLASFLPSFLCHSARAAAAAAAQARIRPGQGLLCVRSAVCAAALHFPTPPPPSYSSSTSFLPHPALHRPAHRRPRNRRLGIAARAPLSPASAGSRSPNGANHGRRLFAAPPGKSRSA